MHQIVLALIRCRVILIQAVVHGLIRIFEFHQVQYFLESLLIVADDLILVAFSAGIFQLRLDNLLDIEITQPVNNVSGRW